jgi:large subunit ribosomal protein L25
MSDTAVLEAKPRAAAGKQASKQLRTVGSVPAVVYGSEIDSVKCSVDQKAFKALINDFGRNAIVSLKVAGGQDYETIVKDIQHHPVSWDVLHIDFHRISMTQRLVVDVLIHPEGIPLGVRNDDGILEQMLHSVEVECLPTNIPETMVFDVTELEIGDTVHVSDLGTPEGATIVTEGDRSVFALIPPSVRKDEEEEEEGDEALEDEYAEPEVIERGKKDDEEGEAE